MKKEVRLTENHLMRIVKRVISEQNKTNPSTNKNSLITFLSYLNCGNSGWDEWRIDESGTNYKDAFLLSQNFFSREEYPKVKRVLDNNCIIYGKKLFWSLYYKNQKHKFTNFYIEMLGGSLHYSWNSEFNRGHEKLEGNELKAIELMKKLKTTKNN
jgi:hypothetical protein